MDSVVRIKSPKTKRLVTINGVAYKNLIKVDHYRDEDLKLLITDPNLIIYPHSNDKIKNDVAILPDEIVLEILQHADIDVIHNYCMTKKNQCSNQFWKFIFKRDNLPLVNEARNIKEWVKMYKKTDLASKEFDLILKLCKLEKVTDLRILGTNKNFNVYLNLNIPLTSGNFYIHFDKDYILTEFPYFIPHDDDVINNESDLKSIFTVLLYFYKSVKIQSGGNHKPYINLRKKDLNEYERGQEKYINARVKFYKNNNF